jgi:hypothetical protein
MPIPLNSTQINNNGVLFTSGLYVSGSGSTLVGALSVENLNASTITITTVSASESSSHAVLVQNLSSSAGTIKGNIGFALRNDYYGSLNNNYPVPYGSVEYTVISTAGRNTSRTEYLGNANMLQKVSEHTAHSTKEFSRINSQFTTRRYVFSGTTTGVENIYLATADIPNVQYIEMPSWESWNFTLRIIARKTDQLASDAFFINGYCDNYDSGTINGQQVQVYEMASPGLAQYLNAVAVFDQNGGANNYFRIQCQSTIGTEIKWVGYLDVVANYASASARQGGAGAL